MTTPDFVQVPPDSAGGKKVDTVRLTTSAGTVERQVVVLADPTSPTGYAAIIASAPSGAEEALAVRQVGSVTVTASSWPLPPGAATDASVQAVTASLGTDGATPPAIPGTGVRGWLRSLYDRLGGTLLVDGSAHVQPVSATSLPLPAGASTEATLAAFEAQAHTDSAALLTSLGTDGATPPTIAGTGVRGWLRAIFDRQADGTQVTQVSNIETDLFGAQIIGQLNNEIEVHFDDPAWATFGTLVTGGGGTGGAATQANGRVAFTSGTNTNGSVTFTTLDPVYYRPHFPSYDAFTAAWVVPPTGASDLAYLGFGTTTDGLFIGYFGTTFGALWIRGGISTFTPLTSWSGYSIVAGLLDLTKGNIWKIEVGLFGYAGARIRWFHPTQRKFVTVHEYKHANTDAEPFLTNFDLPARLNITKSAGGATNVQINTACWGAGSSSLLGRMTDPITDRSLASTVRSVIVGKSTAGGGAYVPVKVNPSGTLATANTSVGPTGTPVPTDATLMGGTDGTNLQPAYVDSKGIRAQDDYATQVPLADLTGAGGVLTFTFVTPVDFVWVTDIGAGSANISRVAINGTASSTNGQPLLNMTPTPFPVKQISTVSVYAPSGSTISVCGYRR